MENKYKFELMGYSFGARIIQRMVWEFAPRLERLYLIAPDGFNTRGMFEISMVPRQIRYALRWILEKKSWFLQILTFFRKHKLINQFIYDFISKHMGRENRRDRLFSYWFQRILTFFKKHKLINQFIYDFTSKHMGREDRRDRLFSYWLSMDDFVIPMRRVLEKLNRIEIPIDLFFGENDPIIPVSTGKMLESELPLARLHILKATHKLVTPALNTLLKKILNKEEAVAVEVVEFSEPVEV